MGMGCGLYIIIQLLLMINAPNNIHELLNRKPSCKLFNKANTYNKTLQFHYNNNNIPLITHAHEKNPIERHSNSGSSTNDFEN
jgi:hypothetical protein